MEWNPSGLRAQPAPDRSRESITLGLLVENSTLVEARYGAQFAVKEINRNGGLNGRPIDVVVKSMEGPWGVGSKKAVDLVFDEQAWALIGLLNGRNSHLVEQVAAKTDIPFISAWAPDPTLSKAYVPQFFNCAPNSEQQARALFDDLIEKLGSQTWVLVSDDDYDSRIATESMKKLDDFERNGASEHFNCTSPDDFNSLSRMIVDRRPGALVVFCEPELSLQLIRFLRSRDILLPVYTSMNILDEQTFSRLVSDRLDNVYFVSRGTWMADRDSDFTREFKDRFGVCPGAMSAYAYDAIQVLAEAILKSGSDRKKLKQSLSKTSYMGKTGTIEFDRFGNLKTPIRAEVVSSKNLSVSMP
jgi:branched-chain amino acid transport system substrate-binding protein